MRAANALSSSLLVLAGQALAQSIALRAEPPNVRVGDRWKYEQHDRHTGARQIDIDRRVSFVTASRIEGTDNGGKFVWTRELNVVKTTTMAVSGVPRQLSFPLEVGKSWYYEFTYSTRQAPNEVKWQFEARVTSFEKVKVAAGEFDAFRIEYKGQWRDVGSAGAGRRQVTNWYAPAARNVVKIELEDGANSWVRQLVAMELQP